MPGSSIHGTPQARLLEWVAMPFSRGSSRPRNRTCISYIYLHWQVGSLPLAPLGKPSITDSMDMNLSKLWETVKDREDWHATGMWSQRVGHDLLTEQQTTAKAIARMCRKGNPVHCWWGCKLVQPLQEIVWMFLKY